MIKQAGDRGPRNCYDAASAGFCCATFASAAEMRETRRALPRRRGLHVKVDCGRSGSDQIHMQTAGQAGPQGRTQKSAPPEDSDGTQTLWWALQDLNL